MPCQTQQRLTHRATHNQPSLRLKRDEAASNQISECPPGLFLNRLSSLAWPASSRSLLPLPPTAPLPCVRERRNEGRENEKAAPAPACLWRYHTAPITAPTTRKMRASVMNACPTPSLRGTSVPVLLGSAPSEGSEAAGNDEEPVKPAYAAVHTYHTAHIQDEQ